MILVMQNIIRLRSVGLYTLFLCVFSHAAFNEMRVIPSLSGVVAASKLKKQCEGTTR